MESSSWDIRRTSLQKIAALSATKPARPDARSDLDRLCQACSVNGAQESVKMNGSLGSAPGIARVPMQMRELDILISLCMAAPAIKDLSNAERLLRHLAPYLLEAHLQLFAPSPFLKSVEPSPWEALSKRLYSAALAMGSNHPPLRSAVSQTVIASLKRCVHAVNARTRSEDHKEQNESHSESDSDAITDYDDAIEIATLTTSILGFLDAAATYADFWTAAEILPLIQTVQEALSEDSLISVETALSTIRNSHATDAPIKNWKGYIRSYATTGQPLGAMLLQRNFLQFALAVAARFVTDSRYSDEKDLLEFMIANSDNTSLSTFAESRGATPDILEKLTDIALHEMSLIEDGADFVKLGSTWQQQLAFSVKASALTLYTVCNESNTEVAELDSLTSWLEDTTGDPVQMADEVLAGAVFRCMSVLAKDSPAYAASLSRTLPRFIVQSAPRGSIVTVVADCLAFVLQLLSQDAVITTLYTLGNVLSSANGAEKRETGGLATGGSIRTHDPPMHHEKNTMGSAISLALSSEENMSIVHGNVIQAIIGIAIRCNNEEITALAQSMLVQKIGKVNAAIDARILSEISRLASVGGLLEFKSLLRLYSNLCHDSIIRENDMILHAIMKARCHLSMTLAKSSPLHDIYLIHLLENIVSKGDVYDSKSVHHADFELAADEIAQLLRPLSLLVSHNSLSEDTALNETVVSLSHDAWFNIVVHGFTTSSTMEEKYGEELRLLAIHLPPLVADSGAGQLDSDFDLNTVLRRGMSSHRNNDQKKALIALLPTCEGDIRGLSYSKVMFLRAAHFMETSRARSGDCTTILGYFVDTTLSNGAMYSCIDEIRKAAVNLYTEKALSKTSPGFSALDTARQLTAMFMGCCSRFEAVQKAASQSAENIIRSLPSALCQRSSLFALLELLTLMWAGCLEEETDEYQWKSLYVSSRGNVSLELSDDYELRSRTLSALYRRAKTWVLRVLNIAPSDVKGLLQTYLSEYEDDSDSGRVALGRSFAVEMGSVIPDTDQRLSAIGYRGDLNINTASDFIAKYTTRQEYRYASALPGEGEALEPNIVYASKHIKAGNDVGETNAVLVLLRSRISHNQDVPYTELRDALRRAAAVLCRSEGGQCSTARYLVELPFASFTKQAIKLGISLWMAVINEKPNQETRILVEVAANWENTVRKRLGMFDPRLRHKDPFYSREEFAPPDKDKFLKRQQFALNLIGPHLKLVRFLCSRFSATRNGSIHVQKIFHRVLMITLHELKYVAGHPLTREVHFQVILFALRVLRYSNTLDDASEWSLKDQIISAALKWFSFPPQWSYGGNRLQIKAETHVLAEVENVLQSMSYIGSKSLQAKKELLLLLLNNEQSRLLVWLFPLDHNRKHHFSTSADAKSSPSEATMAATMRTAWAESPSLALHLVTRFQSTAMASALRWLLLNFPEKALEEPDALQFLLGSSLPNDVSYQLKYLLYWAPVNPVTAVTYFLPAYGNHPFILQYAMRALESHSVEVTFFYVPQIVQALRYDVLGYVERYIIETAKFSQLFAHQIIWNMKANSYKDEDSQIPDPVKPKLDKVMEALISSFSEEDRDFYEREFSFFSEVTDISGKLRPYIKKSKLEKKQKIEEELRKIKVDVGVYLPSNPDGVVIGIDRKSGKPLQSHAKAPYLATFRIKKNEVAMAGMEGMLDDVKNNRSLRQESSSEVWQAAIFKVGDDCRQDVLALQMIAAFRGIFEHIGLDVYVFPYRVTATAPGCGVIDVLPGSISRDMLGREAVNGLYDYFVSKYGGETSIRFQEARSNFVKSMAAYSMISYLLQFKDRHNGNIMIDDAGHILHIDFGFCFDIAPGGIKFERAPFKLTSEMVAVMGGSTESQPYHWFEELCIKAFLASRPYAEKLAHLVVLMLDSGLPCFKPETVQHFRERFVLQKSEREAAEFMRDLIKKSQGSYSTKGYDQFQLMTNGIPY